MDAIKITADNELDISFEEIKDIVKETIDEAKNLNNLIETVCKRIYFRGVRDGEIKIHKIMNRQEMPIDKDKYYSQKKIAELIDKIYGHEEFIESQENL